MVMHARKIARLTDGYNEKLETHPLQAVDKLLSKKNGSEQPGNKVIEGSNLSSRTDTSNSRPSNDSPRTYRSKALFVQKQKERQRESSTGTSPAENSHNNQAGAHHTSSNSTHHKNSAAHEKKIKEILAKANQWTEHISSSGKKYYYNCKTEVSQWEKPKEWLEREKLHKMVSASKDKIGVKHPSSTSLNSNNSSKSGDTKHSIGTTTFGSHSKDAHYLSSSSSYFNKIHGKLSEKQASSSSQTRSASSTPVTSHVSKLRPTGSAEQKSQSGEVTQNNSLRSGLDLLRGTSLSLATDAHGRLKNLVANAPRIERIESKRASSVSPGTPSPGPLQRNHLINQQHSKATVNKTSSSSSPSVDKPNIVNSKNEETQERLSNPSPLSAASVSDLTSPVPKMSPTPSSMVVNHTTSHHVSPDSKKTDSKSNSSPTSTRSPTIENLSKSSTQRVVEEETIESKPLPVPTLTPALRQFCNASLGLHIEGWPAEPMERQARKINYESHVLGAESASQVSVDLKYARSLVRASEIQVTLQEQRLHFLQQQVKELERLKSENAFMS